MGNSLKEASRLGSYVTATVAGEPVRAFVPSPLPPPNLNLNGLYQRLDRATQALARVDELTVLLPGIRFLL